MLVQPTTPELNMLQQHQHSRETHRLTLKIVMNIFQFIAFQLNVVLNKMHRKKKVQGNDSGNAICYTEDNT